MSWNIARGRFGPDALDEERRSCRCAMAADTTSSGEYAA